MHKMQIIGLSLIVVLFIAGCGEKIAEQPQQAPPPIDQQETTAAKRPLPFKPVFAYSQVDCEAQTSQLTFTVYNVFDQPIDLTGAGANKIQVLLNSVPLNGLAIYCGQDTLDPGEHADCYWSPAISLDSRAVLERPITGVAYENTLAARTATYYAKTTFACDQRHSTHLLTTLICDPATKDLSLGIKNIFTEVMDLGKAPEGQTTSNVLTLRVNDHPLSDLASYCEKETLIPGETVDCIKPGTSETDYVATPKGGEGSQKNELSIQFGHYQSEVSFMC